MISAAALMIAVVFLAFAVSPVFFMKEIAVGMAVGVLIDATIVRALLVPVADAPARRLELVGARAAETAAAALRVPGGLNLA